MSTLDGAPMLRRVLTRTDREKVVNRARQFGLWVMMAALNGSALPFAHSETVEIVVEGVVNNSDDYFGQVFNRGVAHDALVGSTMRLSVVFDTDDWESIVLNNSLESGATWVPRQGLTGDRVRATLMLDGEIVQIPEAVTLGVLSGEAYVADGYANGVSSGQDYFDLRFSLLDAQPGANGTVYRSNTFSFMFQSFATDFLQGSTLTQSFEQGGGTAVYWAYAESLYVEQDRASLTRQQGNMSMYTTSVSYRTVSAVPELSTSLALGLGLPSVIWLGMRRGRELNRARSTTPSRCPATRRKSVRWCGE